MLDHERTEALHQFLAETDWTVPTGPLDPLTGLHLEPGDVRETRIWGAEGAISMITSAESAAAYRTGGPEEFCTCSTAHFHEGATCASHLHDIVRGESVPSESQYILFCTEHQHYRHADADDLRELLIGQHDPAVGYAAMVRNWREDNRVAA